MADRHLLGHEELFRITIDQSSVALTVQDKDHRLVLVNPAYCDLVGYQEDELLGHDPVDFVLAPESLNSTASHRSGKAQRTDEDLPNKFTLFRELIHREGRRIPVRLEGSSARGADGSRLWCTTLIDLSGQQLAIEASIQRQELIVREVHHRVKNNLHGLRAVLDLHSFRQPQLRSSLDAVGAQISAVANLHGLHFARGAKVNPVNLVESLADGIAQTFACDLDWTVDDEAQHREFAIGESYTVTVALILNELITNACKHGRGADQLSIKASLDAQELHIRIRNPGKLLPNFQLNEYDGHNSGLGLVNSLRPAAGLTINYETDDSEVTTTIRIGPPILSGLD